MYVLFLLDGPVQDTLYATTLLIYEKVKEDPTTPSNSLQSMANNGVLSKCLVNFHFPVCIYFLCGKAIKHPHNTKTARSVNEYKPVASVGDCVSANLLVSRTHGIIVHMSGFLTRQRYKYVCVFVDHHYDST